MLAATEAGGTEAKGWTTVSPLGGSSLAEMPFAKGLHEFEQAIVVVYVRKPLRCLVQKRERRPECAVNLTLDI